MSGLRERLVELGVVRPRPSDPAVSPSPAARVAVVIGVLVGFALALGVLTALGIHSSAGGAPAAVAGIAGGMAGYVIARRRS